MSRPTLNGDGCIICGAPAHDPHETHRGRNRQLSIKYGMVVAICRTCHRYVHDNPTCEADLKIKEIGKKHFEEHYPHLDFIEVFK